MKKNIVIGFLGTKLDAGKKQRWRPSIAVTQHANFKVSRLELIYGKDFSRLAYKVKKDIERSSPETEVLLQCIDLHSPWDFQEVYAKLFDFARNYGFDEDREDYYIHLTTGTHVAQICWFLLAESRHIPAKLLQTSPPRQGDWEEDINGHLSKIDLDLSRFDAIQQRFDLISEEHNTLLKAGISTKNEQFNAMIERIELVASSTDFPLLLCGGTGTGKSALAEKIYELKLQNRRVKGRFVHINCSTLRGEGAMSALFGHRRGAFNASSHERRGYLREADGGILFLDDIDKLGLSEQAMILQAIETGRFYPVGSDYEVTSKFQVIAAAGNGLSDKIEQGEFRLDLYARLNMWTFELPSLKQRKDDIEPNIEYELMKVSKLLGTRMGFNSDAMSKYLAFALDYKSNWPGNFRDLGASIMRLATLAPRGRITLSMVEEEIIYLKEQWQRLKFKKEDELLLSILGDELGEIDPFDQAQLKYVIDVCRDSKNISEAGRHLFSASRKSKTSSNDGDRLRKYLAKFQLSFDIL